MANTQFQKIIHQLRTAVANETGLSIQPSKSGGDLELLNALVAKAITALTQQIVEYVKRPLGQN